MSFASTGSGMAGCSTFDTGARTPRTRDWSRPPDDPQRANPARPETPEEKRKREWDESCRQETLRVQALAKEAQGKRDADTRQRAEAERLKAEAEKNKRELDERRAEYFRKLDSDAVMVDLACAPHGGLAVDERRAFKSTDGCSRPRSRQ